METQDLFDPRLGRELADEGMERVLNHNPDWRARMLLAFERFAATKGLETEFAGEDWRKYCVEAKLDKPKHPNCWGGLWREFSGLGYVERSGTFRLAKSKKSHRHPIQLWKLGPFFRNGLHGKL